MTALYVCKVLLCWYLIQLLVPSTDSMVAKLTCYITHPPGSTGFGGWLVGPC